MKISFILVFLLLIPGVLADISLDQDKNGILGENDLNFLIQGVEIGILDGRTFLYILDSTPESGIIKCKSEKTCLSLPIYSEDVLEQELVRRYLAHGLGFETNDSLDSLGNFNSILVLLKTLKITGKVTDDLSEEDYNDCINYILTGYGDLCGILDGDGTGTTTGTTTGEDPQKVIEGIKEESAKKLTNPTGDPKKDAKQGLSQKEAKDFLDKMEKAMKDNPPSKPWNQLSKKEKDSYKDMIKDKLLEAYGTTKGQIIGEVANVFKENSPTTDMFVKVDENKEFEKYSDKKAEELLNALANIINTPKAEKNPANIAPATPNVNNGYDPNKSPAKMDIKGK